MKSQTAIECQDLGDIEDLHRDVAQGSTAASKDQSLDVIVVLSACRRRWSFIRVEIRPSQNVVQDSSE